MVSDLIDHTNLSWKKKMVECLFNEEDSRAILAIPIALLGCPYALIWHHNTSGTYRVKTAYRRLKQRFNQEQMVNPDQSFSIPSSTWKSVWSLLVPPKVKTFIWRAIKNSLPVKENLTARGISGDALCPLCKSGNESQEHMSFWCLYFVIIWFAGPCTYKPNLMGFFSFFQWWKDVISIF